MRRRRVKRTLSAKEDQPRRHVLLPYRPSAATAGDRTEQEKEQALLKELQMKGVVNADLHVIEALHHGLEGRSDVIPAGINKDGSLSKTSSALSEDEFALVSSYVRMLIQKTGKQIVDGGSIVCLTTWDRKTDVPIANTMAFVVLMPEWMVLPIAGFPTKQIGRRFGAHGGGSAKGSLQRRKKRRREVRCHSGQTTSSGH